MKRTLLLPSPSKVAAAFLTALLMTVLVTRYIPSAVVPVSWDFRNNLWGPAYLLIHQASPYNIHAIFDASNAIWMPMIIGVLFPVGYLPLRWASNIWLLLNLIILFLIVAISARTGGKSLIWGALATFALALFPSSMSLLRQGQISLVVCLVLLLLSKFRKELPPPAIGALLAISLTKPQLLVLFLPAFMIVCFREQGVQKALRIALYTIIWIFVFCLPLFVLFPNWIPDFLHNLAINNPWFYPSLYSFLVSSPGSRGMAVQVAAIYLTIGLGVTAFAALKLDGFEALLWALAITPMFSPVVWSWDFVLLYPLILFMVIRPKSKIGSWVLYCGYAFCAIAFIAMRLRGIVLDQFTFWVPPSLNAVLLLSRALPGTHPAKLMVPIA